MIKTVDITKKFGNQIAVNKLNLEIPKGISYGLLGPNGAGKTTTLRILSSLLSPTSGEVYIDSQLMNRKSKSLKKNLGLVSQHISLQREMTPIEALKLHGMLHKMKSKDIKTKIDELITFAKMEKESAKLIGKLSGGNKRKLMIVRSVMHNPKILFLDEPSVGLDPAIRRSVWDLLKSLKNDGMTMILTTHYIEEASILCDKIGMMYEGKLINENSPTEFMKEIEPYVVESFNGDLTDYKYFNTRKEGAIHLSNCNENTLIRKTTLEDVYVKYTNKKII